MNVVSVMSRKGGAGKTTIAVNLAAALYRRLPTILVDADEQGSAVKWLTRAEVPTVQAGTSAALQRELRRPGEGVIVADGPPYSEDINRTLYQLADLVVVPVRPSALDIDAAKPILTALAKGKRKGLVVLSQVDTRTNIQDDAREVLAGYGVAIAETEITQRIDHARAVLARLPVIDYRPSSLATFEINALADEVAEILEL